MARALTARAMVLGTNCRINREPRDRANLFGRRIVATLSKGAGGSSPRYEKVSSLSYTGAGEAVCFVAFIRSIIQNAAFGYVATPGVAEGFDRFPSELSLLFAFSS
jgi:hypothetical protein